MNKLAIAFLTKDRVELSKQSIEPLLNCGADIFWCDGSSGVEGQNLPNAYPVSARFGNVRGGAGAAIVFALTTMLERGYEYVGLCENDTLLDATAVARALELFHQGDDLGLTVGAVSARCYVDRVLCQLDSMAVCHNLGAGQIILTREAARLVLDHFRSGFTTDNRRIFAQLAEVDIGLYWAFGAGEHALVADWHWDAVLASHGLASLALTPSPCTMIGQDPPLAQQGLTLATGPVEERIDNDGFARYRERLQAVRDGKLSINVETQFQLGPDGWQYVPHQWRFLGAVWDGDWRFRELRGLGEFGYVGSAGASVIVPVSGMASLLVSGGPEGGQIEVADQHSGYKVAPFMPPEGPQTHALQVPLPTTIGYRKIKITVRSPGVCLFRLTCRERQPTRPDLHFDHSSLPPPV